MPVIYSAKDNSPIDLSESTETTVVVTVPAAFSGTCTSACVPSIIENLDAIKEAGASKIIVVSTDQPFAIQEWITIADWENNDIEFASDYGKFEMRDIAGKLSDEEGKEELKPILGELIRRAYFVYKNGEIAWEYREPDTNQYTLNVEDLLTALRS